MLFKITQQSGKTAPTTCATFVFLDDARMFLAQKQKVGTPGVHYQLWEGSTLLESGSAQEQEATHVFHPTPFRLTLKPWAAPHGLPRARPEEEEGDN